jgi:hypothetical protein
MSVNLYGLNGVFLTQYHGARKSLDEPAPQLLEIYTSGDNPKKLNRDAVCELRDALDKFLRDTAAEGLKYCPRHGFRFCRLHVTACIEGVSCTLEDAPAASCSICWALSQGATIE